ncbi:hypothetical protein MRB53_041076 [Persea americana]|nr:hypothetical protein MRB53_041076 [Persea americana]
MPVTRSGGSPVLQRTTDTTAPASVGTSASDENDSFEARRSTRSSRHSNTEDERPTKRPRLDVQLQQKTSSANVSQTIEQNDSDAQPEVKDVDANMLDDEHDVASPSEAGTSTPMSRQPDYAVPVDVKMHQAHITPTKRAARGGRRGRGFMRGRGGRGGHSAGSRANGYGSGIDKGGLSNPDGGAAQKRRPGRQRAPNADPVVEANMRRQLDLRILYRATVKALKPILAELAQRTADQFQLEETSHEQCDQFLEVEAGLKEKLQEKLAELDLKFKLETQRLESIRAANEARVKQVFHDAAVADARAEFLRIARSADELEDKDGVEVDVEDFTIDAEVDAKVEQERFTNDLDEEESGSDSNASKAASKLNFERPLVPEKGIPRSEYELQTERRVDELFYRRRMRALQSSFDPSSLLFRPRGFVSVRKEEQSAEHASTNLKLLLEAADRIDADSLISKVDKKAAPPRHADATALLELASILETVPRAPGGDEHSEPSIKLPTSTRPQPKQQQSAPTIAPQTLHANPPQYHAGHERVPSGHQHWNATASHASHPNHWAQTPRYRDILRGTESERLDRHNGFQQSRSQLQASQQQSHVQSQSQAQPQHSEQPPPFRLPPFHPMGPPPPGYPPGPQVSGFAATHPRDNRSAHVSGSMQAEQSEADAKAQAMQQQDRESISAMTTSFAVTPNGSSSSRRRPYMVMYEPPPPPPSQGSPKWTSQHTHDASPSQRGPQDHGRREVHMESQSAVGQPDRRQSWVPSSGLRTSSDIMDSRLQNGHVVYGQVEDRRDSRHDDESTLQQSTKDEPIETMQSGMSQQATAENRSAVFQRPRDLQFILEAEPGKNRELPRRTIIYAPPQQSHIAPIPPSQAQAAPGVQYSSHTAAGHWQTAPNQQSHVWRPYSPTGKQPAPTRAGNTWRPYSPFEKSQKQIGSSRGKPADSGIEKKEAQQETSSGHAPAQRTVSDLPPLAPAPASSAQDAQRSSGPLFRSAMTERDRRGSLVSPAPSPQPFAYSLLYGPRPRHNPDPSRRGEAPPLQSAHSTSARPPMQHPSSTAESTEKRNSFQAILPAPDTKSHLHPAPQRPMPSIEPHAGRRYSAIYPMAPSPLAQSGQPHVPAQYPVGMRTSQPAQSQIHGHPQTAAAGHEIASRASDASRAPQNQMPPATSPQQPVAGVAVAARIATPESAPRYNYQKIWHHYEPPRQKAARLERERGLASVMRGLVVGKKEKEKERSRSAGIGREDGIDGRLAEEAGLQGYQDGRVAKTDDRSDGATDERAFGGVEAARAINGVAATPLHVTAAVSEAK